MTSQEKPPEKKSAKSIVVVVVLGVILAAGFVFFSSTLVRYAATLMGGTEQALRQAEELPLIRLVVKENPSVDAEFRAAIEAERQNPTKDGPNRMFRVGAEVRKKYILPALVNADDPHILAAVKLMQDFTQHLQKSSPATCYEFGKIGLQRPEELDNEGAAIFKQVLAAQEDAYLNGKSASTKRTRPSDNDVSHALAEAGYTAADFKQLANYATLSQADGCAATVKLYSAAGLLPTERGAMVARYLLTIAP